jgi:hypothetical protein
MRDRHGRAVDVREDAPGAEVEVGRGNVEIPGEIGERVGLPVGGQDPREELLEVVEGEDAAGSQTT